MADSTLDPHLEAVAKRFDRFATVCRDLAVPLYERLSLDIAEDLQVLALASMAREGQPVPNLLFGAVQFLLLNGVKHPLGAFYPGVTEAISAANADPYPDFRAFCLEHHGEIVKLITSRTVQTNVVRRCAYLMPVFGHVARMAGELPLSLVEIGSSAGLNLLWDRYGYNYGGDGKFGDPDSPVQVGSELRGVHRPPLARSFSPVAFRVGIDLNPIDLYNPTEVLWLRSLVWPGRQDEADLLMAAIEVAREYPPTLVAGDALELLPEVLRDAPQDTALCIYNTHTLNQFSPEAREALVSLINDHGRHRNVYWVSVEEFAAFPDIRLISHEGGRRNETLLGYCDAHGIWLEWLGSRLAQEQR